MTVGETLSEAGGVGVCRCVCVYVLVCLWCVCVTHMNSFLSVMNSSAADRALKHWLVVMKKRAPILTHTQRLNEEV